MDEERILEIVRKLNALYAEFNLDRVEIASVQEIAHNFRVLTTWESRGSEDAA